ncbi:MAG TPA: hypothetical protein VMS76_02905 [Planctomycetota bacterium]|nr:hypothetical protein [Planctomycetota bacterium]
MMERNDQGFPPERHEAIRVGLADAGRQDRVPQEIIGTRRVRVRITVEDYRDQTGSLEWAVDIDGTMWASGDCADEPDGIRKAHECIAAAGIDVSEVAS